MDSSHIIFDKILSLLFSISTDIWCFFIIIVAIVSFIFANLIVTYKSSSKEEIEIYKLCKILDKIIKKITANKDNVNYSLEDIDKEIYSYNNYIISSLWNKYRETAKLNPIEKIHKYFNKTTLIDALTNRRIAEATPGLLTGLGILGTFIGLGKGLTDINISTTETMKSSIENLMIGLKLAFYTSIVGILFSLIWTLADRFLLTYRVKKFMNFKILLRQL